MTHPAAQSPDQLLAECDIQGVRRGGPGGQHRNKVATGVVVIHRPTQVAAEANERRERSANLRHAVFRLRLNLALAIRQPPGELSPLWQSRCRNGRIQISAAHDDFPSLLAESLDVVAAQQFDLPKSAQALNCSATQLLKLIASEPAALEWLHRERAERGLPRVRPNR